MEVLCIFMSQPTLFSPASNRGKPMASSMLLASRIASNFSSWEVASVERREENSTVFARLGLNEAALDRNLCPYLLGFREGIASLPAKGKGHRDRRTKVFSQIMESKKLRPSIIQLNHNSPKTLPPVEKRVSRPL